MPISPNAIDQPAPIAIMLAPARPVPAAPYRATSTRPQTGDAVAPRAQQLWEAATARIRGPIGASATVGPNAATIGAPGIQGTAARNAQEARAAANEAIGSRVDARA